MAVACTAPFGEVVTVRCANVWTSASPDRDDCRPESALWTCPNAEICVSIGFSCASKAFAGAWKLALACWISEVI